MCGCGMTREAIKNGPNKIKIKTKKQDKHSGGRSRNVRVVYNGNH